MADFEVKDKDLAARIGTLKTKHGEIETPAILPVINPNKLTIEPREIKEMGAQSIITNAYILKKDHLHEVVTQGIHDFLDFPGPIMTDSGAYQLMRYGDIEADNEEILEFQEKINTDIGVILDIPTQSIEREEIEETVQETIKRSKESQGFIRDKSTLYAGPLQGMRYPDLFKECTEQQSKLEYDLHAVGSIVPVMERYGYSELVEPMRITKKVLPEDRPIHLFGAGHPMLLPFLVAMGADLFDSAAYSLYAQDGRYMTSRGTKKIHEMHYLPCECPVCSSNSPEQLEKDTGLLARHNLFVTFKEMREIKQAIKEGTLYELLETRCRAHPALKKMMDELTSDMDMIEERDPVSKKHFFKVSGYSEKRPDYVRAVKRASEIEGPTQEVKGFGKVPESIVECYPYSHIGDQSPRSNATDKQKVKGASRYWLGIDIIPGDIEIKKSPKTGRIRRLEHNGKIFAVIRPSDFMLLLHKGAERLHEETEYPKHRIVMDEEASPFVKEGRSVFNKFVVETDPELKPGQPTIIVDESDELLASGESYLSAKEINDFQKGEAAKNRWHIGKV